MSAERLLIFRLGSIGDTAIAMPCFRAIARTFPRHHRILLTNGLASVRASSVESVLQGTDLIHETIYYPVGGNMPRKFWALLLALRRRRVRTLVYLQPRPTAAAVLRDMTFFRTAGVARIIGAPVRSELRQCRADSCSAEVEFEVERLARTLWPQIRVELSAAEFDLQLTESENSAATTHLQAASANGTLMAIAAGAKWAAKDWGEANWAALIESLSLRRPESTLVFVGAADERGLAERLALQWPRASLNLCGALKPRETAAVLERCALLVCHDSGPMHLAASQNTPCVALFGNLNRPHRWFPYGRGHQIVYEPTGVTNIAVSRVADAVERLLHAQRRVAAA